MSQCLHPGVEEPLGRLYPQCQYHIPKR